ncbi:hypothetical protein [Pararhizobium sp.]|uniref:hypothetical protein n=1 Tax=Pararhizobium sp. TaxID=1977563 RepID=UPI003D11DBCA
MGTLDEEIELGMVEEALFGLSVAARLGSLEKAVATVFLREMDGQTGSACLSARRVAEVLQSKEPRVLAALAVLQEKGLIRIIIEPNVIAMAALGDDYRAALCRMGHEA